MPKESPTPKAGALVRGAALDVGGARVFVLSLPSLVGRLPAELTGAEREVASLLLEGLSNREVAARRGTSVRTVANQVAAIFRKLRVGGRTEMGGVLLYERSSRRAPKKPR